MKMKIKDEIKKKVYDNLIKEFNKLIEEDRCSEYSNIRYGSYRYRFYTENISTSDFTFPLIKKSQKNFLWIIYKKQSEDTELGILFKKVKDLVAKEKEIREEQELLDKLPESDKKKLLRKFKYENIL